MTQRAVDTGQGDMDDPVTAISRIPAQLVRAWNAGDAEGFAAPFTETADFVAFEGTHLRGRHDIAAFHRKLFATVVKGTELEGGVRFVRLLQPGLAVMHAWARYLNLPGAPVRTPGRDSMQLFVLTGHNGPGTCRPCRTPAS